MARNSTPDRYYPPGLNRGDPLARLYDLFYQSLDQSANTNAMISAQLAALLQGANGTVILTGNNANGSMTVQNGRIISFVNPT